jgi:hypothetical protein
LIFGHVQSLRVKQAFAMEAMNWVISKRANEQQVADFFAAAELVVDERPKFVEMIHCWLTPELSGAKGVRLDE